MESEPFQGAVDALRGDLLVGDLEQFGEVEVDLRGLGEELETGVFL